MRTVQTYKKILKKLLPRGPIWEKLNSTFDLILESYSEEPLRVDTSSVDLMRQVFPETADDTLLLPDYESFALYDDEKPIGGETELQRQQVLRAKMRTSYSGPSRQFFTDLGTKFGMTVVVTDGLAVDEPARVDLAEVEDARVSDASDAFRFNIQIVLDPQGQTDKFKAMVERLKPAHTLATYS